jgi:hypothetical protein
MTLMFFPARRAKENSPAIHRWVSARNRNESRQGRQKTGFLSPLRGSKDIFARDPSDESLG